MGLHQTYQNGHNGYSKEEKKEKGTEIIFEELKSKNLLNLMKKINLYTEIS